MYSKKRNLFLGFSPFKDENNHEPTVQAQQYGSIFRSNSALHPRHPPQNSMSQVEIGKAFNNIKNMPYKIKVPKLF